LEPYTEQLKELFNKQLPHTVNQTIEMIDKAAGIRLKPFACRGISGKNGYEMQALRYGSR